MHLACLAACNKLHMPPTRLQICGSLCAAHAMQTACIAHITKSKVLMHVSRMAAGSVQQLAACASTNACYAL
jgi:hypothetical protein